MTPSPEDWLDLWIYFLIVDRFNNPTKQPKTTYDANFGGFQGGTIDGIRPERVECKGVATTGASPRFGIGEIYHGY